MSIYFFLTLLCILQTIYWYVGKRAAQKVKEQKEYFLAKREVRTLPLMMTFIGAQVGGGLVLGASDAAYQYGWWVLLYPLGACLGLLALGLGIGKRLASFNTPTIAQILEEVYQSPGLKRLASLLSIISLFMILTAQFIASYTFLKAIGIGSFWVLIAFWGLIVSYTVRGGLRAVISTDMAQATLFSCVFFSSFAYLYFQNHLPSFTLSLATYDLSSTKLIGWLLMPFLYMLVEQDMGQRCFAADSPKTVSRAAIGAMMATLLICIVPITFGVMARAKGLIIPEGASTLMTAVSYATNPWISACVGCAVLAAVVATSTSLINAISSNLALDFSFFHKQNNLRTAKMITFSIASGALVFALFCHDIVGTLIQSYELFVSGLFVPIFIALFKRKGNFISAFLSIAFGISSFVLFKWVDCPIPAGIANPLISLLGFSLGEMWVRAKSVALNM